MGLQQVYRNTGLDVGMQAIGDGENVLTLPCFGEEPLIELSGNRVHRKTISQTAIEGIRGRNVIQLDSQLRINRDHHWPDDLRLGIRLFQELLIKGSRSAGIAAQLGGTTGEIEKIDVRCDILAKPLAGLRDCLGWFPLFDSRFEKINDHLLGLGFHRCRDGLPLLVKSRASQWKDQRHPENKQPGSFQKYPHDQSSEIKDSYSPASASIPANFLRASATNLLVG